jgi:outer membrane protein assembly factor BamA
MFVCFCILSIPGYPYVPTSDPFNGSDSLLITTGNTTIPGNGDPKDLFDLFKRPRKNQDSINSLKNNGLGPYFAFLPAIGYAIASGYIGGMATCVSFFTDPEKSKNSSILAGAYYTQYNQYWTIINSNIFLDKEKFNLIGDWRLYKFPTNTFGLGTNTTPDDADPISYNYLKLYEVGLEEVLQNVYVGLGYHLDYHFNISEINPDTLTEFQKYGLTNQSISSGISFNVLYDDRSNTINPLRGTYANVQFRQNCTFLGSNQNWNSVLIDAREYINFPATTNNVLAFWSYNDFTFRHPPYLDLPSIGWDTYNNTGRGYAQGRFRGKSVVYLESEYRFGITDNGLLGGVVYANEETFTEWPSNQFGSLKPGYGFGIRIKLNKHSSTNLAIDYAFGQEGSRGFYFNLGEVF